MLIFMDHGNGHEGVCYDDTYSDHLDLTELEDLSAHNIENQFNRTDFDMVAFDACLMQQTSVIYALKDFCDYVLASQMVIYAPGMPAYTMMKTLNDDPDIEMEELCKKYVEQYDLLHASRSQDYCLSAIDVEAFTYDLMPMVNVLGERLIFGARLYKFMVYKPINNARLRAWDTLTQFMDLYDFSDELENEVWLPNTIGETITEYAGWVKFYLNETIIANVVKDDDEVPAGLSVFFPIQDFIDRSEIDSSDFGDDFIWDEFLDEYFNPGSAVIDPALGPEIIIEQPGDYDFINGTVEISGKIRLLDRSLISSDVPLVEFSIDRGIWSSADINNATADEDGWFPWTFDFVSTGYPNGLHRITVRGFQFERKSYWIIGEAWDHVEVNLDNGIGNHPPYIEITDPVDDQVLENETVYTVTGKASDKDQGVQYVEVFVDGFADWEMATGNTSWIYEWDVSQDMGWKTLKARAYDGMTYSYTDVDVYIINAALNSPPVAVISWPKEAAEHDSDEAILFDGSNSTDVDGDRLGYSWSSNISGFLSDQSKIYMTLQPGHHLITLEVTDPYYASKARVNITVIEVATETFLVVDYEQGGYREVEAYLTQTRDNCYVYVEKGYSVDAVAWANSFNDTIYPRVRQELGNGPDQDADGHVWILACYLGGGIAGYYMDDDPNNKDLVYLDTTYGDVDVIAHEFGHMVHHNYDRNEERWIDEGLAQYTPWFIGMGPIDTVTHISYFFANPDITLNWKYYSNEWPILLSQYGVGIAFVEYLSEHFNGTDDIGELLRDGESFDPPSQNYQGIEGVKHMLSINGYNETFLDIFKNFTIANFLDDPNYDQGQYGYPGIKANGAATREITEFPANGSDTVNSYAADYIRIRSGKGTLNIEFDGDIDGTFFVTLAGYTVSGSDKKIATSLWRTSGPTSATLLSSSLPYRMRRGNTIISSTSLTTPIFPPWRMRAVIKRSMLWISSSSTAPLHTTPTGTSWGTSGISTPPTAWTGISRTLRRNHRSTGMIRRGPIPPPCGSRTTPAFSTPTRS
jgi:hypothetical protein